MERRINANEPSAQKTPYEHTLAPAERVSAEWVRSSFHESVRLNSESHVLRKFPEYRALPTEFQAGFISEALDVQIIAPDRKARGATEQVTSILLNSNIRRGNRELIEDYIPHFRQNIDAHVRDGAPIEIVLPTLPFKDQNPLTTQHSLSAVDLGEYLHFAQLRNICASVESVYAPGVRFQLLTDGLVYADFFAEGQRDQIEQYRRNCEQIRDEMGLHDTVNIVDMEWLLADEAKFFLIQKEIASLLDDGRNDNPDTAQGMRSLQRGMLLNIPAPEQDFDAYASLIAQPFDQLPRDLQDRTRNIAIEYSSFLLAMRKLNLVQRNFPDALRATVHPKNAPQVPLHLVNKHSVTFPYNGVPVVSEGKFAKTKSFGKSTRIMRFYQVLEIPDARAIYCPQSDEPFYYMTY